MNHRILSMESVIIIGLTLSIYTTLARVSARHDEAVKALNSRILKEIKSNREMIPNKCKDDNSIASGHTDGGNIQKKIVGELKKEITDAIVKILYDELKQVTHIESLQKRIMAESMKKDERNDKAITPVSLTTGATPGLGLKRDDVAKSIDLWKKQVKDSSENGPPGLWGRDEVHGPPGLWGREDIRGPPGLWGKKDVSLGPPGLWGKEVINAKRILSDNSPPGLWGRAIAEGIGNEKWHLSKSGPPGLWGKEVEKKINLSENKGTFDDSILNNKDN